jgi:acetyltransferase-like isoleucine patch superfamily enzyme
MTLRRIILAVIALQPGFVKKPMLRLFFGYKIGKRVKIGTTLLDCKSLSIADDVKIGHGNAFLQCGDVTIGEHTHVGHLNLFRGGRRIALGAYTLILRLNVFNAIPDNDCSNQPDEVFETGYGAVITAEHRIDFTDSVFMGRCSILGGRNSSLWTHNRRTGKPIHIGKHCYIGSEVRMAPGARIPDRCILGMGSVVTKAHGDDEAYSLIAGVPAKRRRGLGPDDEEMIFAKTRKDLPDDYLEDEPLAQAAAAQGKSQA